MSTPVITGIRDGLKQRLSEEGEPIIYEVFWVAAYDGDYIYDHEHVFQSHEEAESLLARINERCLTDGEVDADRFDAQQWGRQPRPNTPAGVAREAMWEVKEALADGWHVDPHVVAAVGL